MPTSKVVVIFSSLRGGTERMALAAALGAVQARGVIRLRRLDPGVPTGETETNPESATALRLQRDYVPPGRGDLQWADAVILAPSPDPCTGSWDNFFDIAGGFRPGTHLQGKIGVVLPGGLESETLRQRLPDLGMTVLEAEVPPDDGHSGGTDRIRASLVHGRLTALAVAGPATWPDAANLLPGHDNFR